MDWWIFTFQISKNQHYEKYFKNIDTLHLCIYIYFKIKE